MDFDRDIAPRHGRSVRVSPLIRRIVAPNPGPFTYTGTGTYIVGRGAVAVIDPGPDMPQHIEALLAALDGATVRAILVTHTHRDHSPAARPLANATGAPLLGCAPHGEGRSDATVEEGADRDYRPDRRLDDGEMVAGPGWTLQALHTPGHTSNHLCFALAEESALFSGDHVMGWSTTVIAPPDGDMAAYMASLERLAARRDAVLWPTHGPPMRQPHRYLRQLIAHRRGRERAILAILDQGPCRMDNILDALYSDISRALRPAAAMSVLAHLIDLHGRSMLAGDAPPTADDAFQLEPGKTNTDTTSTFAE